MSRPSERIWIGILVLFLGVPLAARAEPIPLDKLGHIHGIAMDPSNPEGVLLATHIGLFAGTSDGLATRVSELNVDLTALAVDPRDSRKLFASGKSKKGGNLGVMVSGDGGKTWRKISDGMDGPVAFQAIAVSSQNPDLLFGIDKDLQISRDGGISWQRAAKAPERLFALSVSSRDENTLFAATMKGLMISRDGGRNWEAGFTSRRPATMVWSKPEGRQFAFVYGTGLIKAEGQNLAWKTLASRFQDRVIMGLTVSTEDPDRLYAYAGTGAVMTSGDGGKTWTSFEGSKRLSAKTVGKGRKLYVDNCQACHGTDGIGERPKDPYGKDEYGFVAPALNDDAHAWHHSDRQLVEMILDGSKRNERMIAWKQTISREDAENLVAYIKSLWSFRSLACQGARHMACMR